jgi:hypothetical protein
MEPTLRTIIWQQFGAAIDMLEKALRACPDGLWNDSLWNDTNMRPEFSAFWYIGYHTLFWVDLYLTGSVDGFTPPAPFTLDELDPAGRLPDRPYTREELLAYLGHGRKKLWATAATLTDEKAAQLCRFPWGEVSFLELLLDNMRHVQEHGAQLNMYLGQKVSSNSRWVGKTNIESGG